MQANCTSELYFSFTKYFKKISLLRSVLPWNKKNTQLNILQFRLSTFFAGCRGGFVSHWCPGFGGFLFGFIDFKRELFGKNKLYMLALVKTPLSNLIRCTKEFFSALLSMDKNIKDGN